MKTKILIAILLSAFVICHSALGQGTLTPPGAPAPTMKTLTQIEPRTPISTAPFTITNPGAYYLTANLTVASGNAIVIATNGVLLDLNGFTLKSTEASPTGYAILINSGLHNLTIVNGFIEGGVTNSGFGVYSGPGFSAGISVGVSATFPLNTRVSGVSVTGCLNHGIYVGQGDSTVVESCTVRTVGGSGIVASTVRGCVAKDCGLAAVFGYEVADSRGEAGGSSYGVYATTANNCYGYSPFGTGLNVSAAENCIGVSVAGTGLNAGNANNCTGTSTNGYGVYATAANNCYGYSNSGTGIYGTIATGCYGYSNGSGSGLYCYGAVNNCTGSSNSGFGLYGYAIVNNSSGYSNSGTGLGAYTSAIGCYGYSYSNGDGVDAYMAENCDGNSQGSGTGLSARVATGCYGYSNSGTAIAAYIATGCDAEYATGTKYNVTHNVNSF